MNDQQLEEKIAQLIPVAVEEGEFEDEAFEVDDVLWVLRPPKTGTDVSSITLCEQKIGRHFSPSYRHFLRLHNGWRNLQDKYDLFGTDDFDSSAVNEVYSLFIQAILDVAGFDAGQLDTELFSPANWFRFVDSNAEDMDKNASALLRAVKGYLDNIGHKELSENSYLCVLKYTIVGTLTQDSGLILLDNSTVRSDGEMDLIEYRSHDRYNLQVSNFYEFLDLEIESMWMGD